MLALLALAVAPLFAPADMQYTLLVAGCHVWDLCRDQSLLELR